MDSLAFLERASKSAPQPLYVVHGDEGFLKRQVMQAIRTIALGQEQDAYGLSTHPGDKATFADVHDELETVPFFSGRRLVVVENADPFVTKYRSLLEKALGDLPRTATLVLDVKTWASNTRLARLVDSSAAIACKAPPAYRLPQWCVQWTQSCHGKQLTTQAANLLVELTGPEMGQLDQELLKLCIYVGKRTRIDAEDVDRLVGRSREETTWKIFDAIAAGRPGDALAILDRLFDQGEDAMRILGAFSFQLRRLAQAARLNQQGQPLTLALEKAGVLPYVIKGAEQQLKHLGRRRLERLYDWLLEVDLGVKGGSPLPPRLLLERLVVRLARKNSPNAVRSP